QLVLEADRPQVSLVQGARLRPGGRAGWLPVRKVRVGKVNEHQGGALLAEERQRLLEGLLVRATAADVRLLDTLSRLAEPIDPARSKKEIEVLVLQVLRAQIRRSISTRLGVIE